MKPHGPIPPQFRPIDGELALGGLTATELVAKAGDTPIFAYDLAIVRDRVAQFRRDLPGEIALHYAVKANPFSSLLQEMTRLVDGFDIASGGELRIASAAGVPADKISFAGPGKRDDELAAAIAVGVTINCESQGELERIIALADKTGARARVAIRVNPDFEIKGSGMKMGGGAKPFGVDPDLAPDLVRKVAHSRHEWRGFHIFAGSQSLDAEGIAEAQRLTVDLAGRLAKEAAMDCPALNLGGGFGIPYFAGDLPLDTREIGRKIADVLNHRPPALQSCSFSIELGRWLVGECGVYLTRVIDRKTSHGETFLVTDGGLHHQLAASGNFGTVIRRNYPIAVANRFTEEADETVSVVGCLCTPLDRLGDQVGLPHAEVGDLVALFCAGAYGATASPATFLGHGPAREVLIDESRIVSQSATMGIDGQ